MPTPIMHQDPSGIQGDLSPAGSIGGVYVQSGAPAQSYGVQTSTLFLRNDTVVPGLSGTTNCFGVGDSLEFARSLYVACASGMIFSLNLTSLGTNRLFWPNRMSAANFVLDPETSELFIAAMNYSGPPSPSSGQIDVLNLTTGQFDGNFSTRPYPGPMVFDPLNHLIYVANSLLGYLSVVDPRAHQTISSAQTVGAVGDMAVDQATGSILLPEIAYDAVEVYSPTAGTVVGSYGVGSRPTAVVYDNQSNRVYISESGGDNVTVLNGTTYGVVGAITVGLGPDALALDTADGYLFVNNGVSRTISVINLTTSVVSRTLPGQLSSEQSGDTLSDELTYDGLTGQVYATSAASQGISVIDARNLTVLRSSRMGASPEALCYDPTNERLFVADNGANLIEEYNGSTLQLEHTSELNATPYALLLDPNDHDLFVSEQTGVQVFDGTSLQLLRNVSGPRQGFGMAADSADGLVYIADDTNSNNSLTAIDDRTFAVSARVPIPVWSDLLQYDPPAGRILVGSNGNLTSFNASNQRNLGLIQFSTPPTDLRFDPIDGRIYVAFCPGISIYDATTLALVGTISAAGDSPCLSVYNGGTSGTILGGQAGARVVGKLNRPGGEL